MKKACARDGKVDGRNVVGENGAVMIRNYCCPVKLKRA